MKRRPPVSTRTYTLFPYTTLFRSCGVGDDQQADGRRHPLHPARARPPDGGIAPEEAAGYRLAACQVVGRIGKLDEGRGFGHHIFVLAPEERPILMVLGEIGLDDQRPGHDTPGDEAEIGAVVTIGHFLRARTDARDERNVRPRMIAEQEVDATKHRIGADDLGKRLVQRVSGEAVIRSAEHTSELQSLMSISYAVY